MNNSIKEKNVDLEYGIREFFLEDKVVNLQKKFSKNYNVYTIAIDDRNQWINDFYGNEKEIALINKYISMSDLNLVNQLLLNNPLEDQIVVDSKYDNIKIAAVSAKIENKPYLMWLVCCVLMEGEYSKKTGEVASGFDKVIDMDEFLDAIDSLRNISDAILCLYDRSVKLASEKVENIEVDCKDREYKRYQALFSLIKLVEEADDISLLSHEALAIIGEFLDLSTVQIISYNEYIKEKRVSVMWSKEGVNAYLKEGDIFPFPLDEVIKKPIIISSNSKKSELEKELMAQQGIYALMFIPISENSGKNIYLCVTEYEREREFYVDEIKFINEVVKMTKSVFARKIQNDLDDKYHLAYRKIINDMPGSALVRDAETKEVIFADNLFESEFTEVNDKGREYLLSELEISRIQSENREELYFEARDKWYEVFLSPIIWIDGTSAELFVFHDITEKKIAMRNAQRQVYNDYLTGIWNRTKFEVDIRSYLTRAKAMKAKGVILIMDLDDFKYINEELGHRYGDELLSSIAIKLKDIEDIEDNCYRISGDEFAVLIKPVNYPRTKLIIERIQAMFQNAWEVNGQVFYCTMSMGIVVFPDEGATVDKVITKLERTLLEAKRKGKNQIVEFNEKLEYDAVRRKEIEKYMRLAINESIEEFSYELQPIISIQDKNSKCVGAEVLIRWNNLKMGMLYPDAFIPLAESTGMINEIGKHILYAGCKENKYWSDHGQDGFRININLSVIQLLNPNIISTVSDAIESTGANPNNITIEVTENFFIQDISKVKEILVSIKKLGVKIALDDFGTGYSSLNYIKELPFDIIKIDKSFIATMDSDSSCISFIKFLCELANDLNLLLCVEGVENVSQYEALQNMGLHMIQGYYVDKPLEIENFRSKYL